MEVTYLPAPVLAFLNDLSSSSSSTSSLSSFAGFGRSRPIFTGPFRFFAATAAFGAGAAGAGREGPDSESLSLSEA